MEHSQNINDEIKSETLLNECVSEYKSNLGDRYHELKRNSGFAWFDRMLTECGTGKCPGYLSPENFYHIIDMSLEGYALQKAFHFSEAKVGINDQERYFKARGRISRILACKKETTIRANLFDQDSKQVYYSKKNSSKIYESARRRRGYWNFLKEFPNNNSLEEYFAVCNFVEKIHKIYTKEKCTEKICENYKEILDENYHIATPIDLYRFCILRKRAGTNK